MIVLTVLVVVVVLAAWLLGASVRMVQQYEQGVVLRFGRLQPRLRGPGLHFIVPFVDSYSVWRGPTNTIVTKHVQVFDALSFTFPVPCVDGGAKLGLPDLLFFALFLGAAARWRLRTGWTWVCLTASIGGTIALATVLEVDGLPALPLLSVGFLLPNADLLWRAVRDRNARDPRRSPT